jgi:hypothetical protein
VFNAVMFAAKGVKIDIETVPDINWISWPLRPSTERFRETVDTVPPGAFD